MKKIEKLAIVDSIINSGVIATYQKYIKSHFKIRFSYTSNEVS